jgi:hypothetical protein
MILDGFLQFSSAQNLAQVAGSYDSTNVIDLGLSGIPLSASGGGARDIGIGDDPAMKLLVLVTTTFTSAGAATLQVSVQGAPDNGSGVPGSYNIMAQSDVFAKALLIAGARLFDIDMPRPQPGQALPRFIKLVYAIGTATTTAGNCTSYLVLDRHDLPEQSNAVLGGYPAGINIAN